MLMRGSWVRAVILALCGSTVAAAAWTMTPGGTAEGTRGGTPAGTPGAGSSAGLRLLLQSAWTPSASELTAIDAGTAIVRQVPADTNEDLTFVGTVHIDAPAERFVERFRDIERFDNGKSMLRIRQFHNPATLDDLARLELRDRDLRSLASCTPGDCAVMLPGPAIARFQKEIDWKSPAATGRANALAREILLDRLQAYQRGGDRALVPYHYRETPLDTLPSVQAVLARTTPIVTFLPELFAYLRDFPRAAPIGSDDFYYWSEVEFGLKPTLRLNHVMIYRAPPNSADILYAVVTKQLYSSHYFHTALEVRFLVADGRMPAGSGFYLVTWIDARSESLTGLLGPIIRVQARRKSRAGIADYLQSVKEKLEGTPAKGA
jgi:hypothetical protein